MRGCLQNQVGGKCRFLTFLKFSEAVKFSLDKAFYRVTLFLLSLSNFLGFIKRKWKDAMPYEIRLQILYPWGTREIGASGVVALPLYRN